MWLLPNKVGRENSENEFWTDADTETERRQKPSGPERNCLKSLRQEVAGCVSGTARKTVKLEENARKGPKRMGWGFYSEPGSWAEDYKQSRR